MLDLKNIIESLLFVSDEPLTLDKLRAVLETVDSREIRVALQALSDTYEARGGGFYLQEVAGGWQIRSRPEYNEWIKRLLQPSPQRLSRAALETLAVIAYKQPIIRVDIEHIRGVDCGGVLRQLMERKLIRVLGRREIAGRPLIYATTKLFLEMFDLKDLNDLPTPKEIAELGNTMVDSSQPPTGESTQPEPQPPAPEGLVAAVAPADSPSEGEVTGEMDGGEDLSLETGVGPITSDLIEPERGADDPVSEEIQPAPEEPNGEQTEDPKNS